jgi:membrane associated rhomboid family serine protease
MLFHEQSEDYRPLFWLGGRPFYVNTVLFALHVIAFAVVALAVSFFGTEVIMALSLGSYEAVHGEVWRLISYIVFPPEYAITFIFAMGFLVYFGRQVETHVGRKIYALLYGALVLIPALLLCFCGVFGYWKEGYIGGYGSIFGVFIAFATLYPGVEINIWFVNLTAKGWAYALLAVLSLCNLAFHQWIDLGALWCDAIVGYFGMRLVGAGYGMTWLVDWIEDRQTARLVRQRQIRVLKDTKATESIDEILEKISKQGVGSLNAKERAALERARTNLLKRDQR